MSVEAPRLPETKRSAWWHGSQPGRALDDKVKVGVVDTGAGPHADLEHVIRVGAFIDGAHIPDSHAGLDVDVHGTHVCGTIGARPSSTSRYASGTSPGAELYCARVFRAASSGANQGDIASAIDHLSADRGVDLINLSLGAPQPSEIERDAIIDALERGTLCICAAANSAGPVEYPAAFKETVAVSALGLEGWAPAGSLSATRYPESRERYGHAGLFLANFSCFGPEIDCAAPGVGIIATVPERFSFAAPYGAMDGTSMASPVACGLLTRVLSSSPTYLGLPRNVTRSDQARSLLRGACRDVGLKAIYQGQGLPTAA